MRYPTQAQIKSLKEQYPPGTLLQLTADMLDENIPAGSVGKVIAVDDIGSIHMKWESGSTLALIPGQDSFRTLTPEKQKKRSYEHER